MTNGIDSFSSTPIFPMLKRYRFLTLKQIDFQTSFLSARRAPTTEPIIPVIAV